MPLRPLLLAWRNANGNVFRSWVVSICAALMAGFAVSATIIIGGAQRSLDLALQRLGADIIVVPAGAEAKMENAFLMGVPEAMWMPEETTAQVAAIPGVEAVSPQFFLSTLRGATCCSVPEMFLIAYEPKTDFTLRPWLERHHESALTLGEAVGGSFIYVPLDPGYILIYGYEVNLRGNLEPTGTGLDQSMFFTFETARDIARLSSERAVQELVIPEDSISAVMVRTSRDVTMEEVSQQIEQQIPGVTAVESSNLFHSQRVQILGLFRSVIALLALTWGLFVALIGLVFSMAINERRQEIGVLRALGFNRRFVLRSLIGEGAILAMGGGIIGIGVFTYAVYLFRHLIVRSMGVPYLIPSWPSLTLLMVGALLLALISVTLGALIPALRISMMDPAVAMRE